MSTITVVESIADLIGITNPINGQTVYVKSYYSGLNSGGGEFIFDPSKTSINDSGLIFNGWVRANFNIISPESFGAKANDLNFDSTNALNNAFNTGFDIYSTSDKTYYVTKNLRTKGQRLIGNWKIHSKKITSRAGIWEKIVQVVDEENVNTDTLKMMFVANAYDLSEFLYIKSLGFNTLQHYSGMHIQGWDNDGDVFNMLDNAKSAGLKVIVSTQNDLGAIADVASWVASIDSHSAIIGYSVIDEPAYNGKTIPEQDARISLLRGVTSKLLTTVDFTIDPITKLISDNYDIIFLDIYNDSNLEMSEEKATQEDLYKMRAALGLYSRQYKCQILPVVMGFKYINGAPLSRIIKTSKIFAKACGGNFGCFVWDGDTEPSIETSVRNSNELDKMCRDICSYKNLKWDIPKTLLWGYINNQGQTDNGLYDLIKHQVHNDPYKVGEVFEGINAYPTQVTGGSIDTDSTSLELNEGIGLKALWFKGTYGAYVSDIPMRKYNYMRVHAGTLQLGLLPIITIRGSSTGGYGLGVVLATIPTIDNVETVKFENQDESDLFCIKYDSTGTTYYRTYIRGVYVTSNW